MHGWPAITDQELLARLRLPDAELPAHLARRHACLPPRVWSKELLEHALAYPWQRPVGSYLLRDGAVDLISCEADYLGLALDLLGPPRVPLLAFGANGAPERLAAKLAPLEPARRSVLGLAGGLHDFDAGPSAHLALYGAMPATLFESPGTVLRAFLLWVEPAQLERLAQTEPSYALGRLLAPFTPDLPLGWSQGRLETDLPLGRIHAPLAFISRFGAFCPEGETVALGAIPARHRRVRGISQRELLATIAQRVLGPGAGPEELMREACRDFGKLAARVAARARSEAEPFTCSRFERYPSPRS